MAKDHSISVTLVADIFPALFGRAFIGEPFQYDRTLPFCRRIRQRGMGQGNSRGPEGAVTERDADRRTYGHLHYSFEKRTE
jgi:hypothetical protein